MKMGFQASALQQATERAAQTIELEERIIHKAPAPYVQIMLMPFDGELDEHSTVYWVKRSALLELVSKQKEEDVVKAHKLMHGVGEAGDWQ